jgi:ABC-type sulfate/molybdate transport systems ATPase subunit
VVLTRPQRPRCRAGTGTRGPAAILLFHHDRNTSCHPAVRQCRSGAQCRPVDPQGEVFGIIGRSGAGKSTLVRTINLLNRPTSGRIVLDGQDLTSLSSSQLREARRGIGMIFQHFNLLSSRSVYDNIALPLELAGKSKPRSRPR